MSDEDVPSESPSFDALWQTVISDDANLRDALRRVAETGCGLLANCRSASVTLIEQGRPITVGSTDDTAEALDAVQYAAREGPCLTAAEEHRVVRIEDVEHDERWPSFSASAQANGVRSSLSLPLMLAGNNTFAGFNIYGGVVAAFSDEDEQLSQAFAAQASIVVSNVQAYWAAFELSRNLTRAMEARAVIEQAKGVLMSTHRIGADAAFDLLRVAADVVDETTRETPMADDLLRPPVDISGCRTWTSG